METRLRYPLAIGGLLACMGGAIPLRAQCSQGHSISFLATPAVSGYEQQLAGVIRNAIKDFSPKTDNLANVYVTLGSGSPHRLIVAPIDQPGYVVSEITSDGYLRVQRLPQRPPNAVFDLLHAAQPVWVMARDAKIIAGVFCGLSVHLQSGRQNAPTMAHPDDMYVDIGASSAEEVRASGVDVLDPISLPQYPQFIGTDEIAGPAAGDRFGRSVMLELLRLLSDHKKDISGTLTIAFATQQWTGGRGLDRLLNELHPDELIYVGRIMQPRIDASKTTPATRQEAIEAIPPGSGVLIGVSDASAALSGVAAELKKIGDSHNVRTQVVAAVPPAMTSYAKATPLPARFAHLGVPSLYPVTPAETIDTRDVSALQTLLYRYIAGKDAPPSNVGWGSSGGSNPDDLRVLTETYGASGHEEVVREQVKKLLPSWAKPATDGAGNLVLKLGSAKANWSAAEVFFVANMAQ